MIQLFDDLSLTHSFVPEPEIGFGHWSPEVASGPSNWHDDTPLTLSETSSVSTDAHMAWMTSFAAKTAFSPQFGAEAGDDDDATDLGEIVVTGEHWEYPMTVPYSPGGGDPTGGGGSPGGGGGGATGQQPGPGHQGEDCATAEIQDKINHTSTNNTTEHTAAVYKGADGLYHATPVFDGSGGTVGVAQLIGWLIANNIGFDQLTSLYHNHDDAHVPDDANNVAVNMYPSSLYAGNGTGDWVVADLFVHPNPALGQHAGADPAIFKLTVEDTNGVARDFAYADRAKYEALTLAEMKAGKDLPPAEHGCGGT